MDGAARDGAAGAFNELLPDRDGIGVSAVTLALEDGQQEEVFKFADGRCWIWHSTHCRQNTGLAATSFRRLAGFAGCWPCCAWLLVASRLLASRTRLLAGFAGCSRFALGYS